MAGDSEAIPDRVGVSEVSGEAEMAGGVPVSSVSLFSGRPASHPGALPMQGVSVSSFFDGGDDLPQDADPAADLVLAGIADESEQTRSVDAGGATDAGNPLVQDGLGDVSQDPDGDAASGWPV